MHDLIQLFSGSTAVPPPEELLASGLLEVEISFADEGVVSWELVLGACVDEAVNSLTCRSIRK